MAKKFKMKGGFGKKLAGSLVCAGTGVGINILESAIGKNDMVNYGMLVGGALLPALVGGDLVDSIGKSATAIGAYKVAESLDLAGTLGLNTPSTTGLNDRYMVGRSSMFEDLKKKQNAENKGGLNYSRNAVNPIG